MLQNIVNLIGNNIFILIYQKLSTSQFDEPLAENGWLEQIIEKDKDPYITKIGIEIQDGRRCR